MERLKNKLWAQIFIIYTRYLVGGAFVFASLVKIQGNRFTTDSGAENPIDSSWHLFETLYQSGLYWKFIGVSQLIAGGLLMTQRYARLGAVMNLPIILNVFVITLSYYFAFTPVITGFMLAANIMLVLWEWNTLKMLFNLPPTQTITNLFEKDVHWQRIGLILFVFTFVIRLFALELVGVWFVCCLLVGVIGLFIGLSRHKKRTKKGNLIEAE